MQLVNYSDSESGGGSDAEEPAPDAKKRKICHAPLPLPTAIKNLFSEEEGEGVGGSSPGYHQGRVRSFPHQRGNWASYVFVPFPLARSLRSRVEAFVPHLSQTLASTVPEQAFVFSPVPPGDTHISVSRTVALQYHWIQPLVDGLGGELGRMERFDLGLSKLAFYCNDNGTRSFLGLSVSLGHTELCALVSLVDEHFRKFRLQSFYKEPSFHLSLCWCLGNVLPHVSPKLLQGLQERWDGLSQGEGVGVGGSSEMREVCVRCEVGEVHFKTGNKLFSFQLS